jgi:hypothetical protein
MRSQVLSVALRILSKLMLRQKAKPSEGKKCTPFDRVSYMVANSSNWIMLSHLDGTRRGGTSNNSFGISLRSRASLSEIGLSAIPLGIPDQMAFGPVPKGCSDYASNLRAKGRACHAEGWSNLKSRNGTQGPKGAEGAFDRCCGPCGPAGPERRAAG